MEEKLVLKGLGWYMESYIQLHLQCPFFCLKTQNESLLLFLTKKGNARVERDVILTTSFHLLYALSLLSSS